MIKVTVYGRLRKFLGQSTFEVDAASPRQAFSFLITNFEGVADHIKEQEYCVMAGNVKITEDLIDLQTESDIKIIPVVHGEVVTFILAAASFATGAIAAATGGTLLGIAATTFYTMGASFLLQGVSNLLFPPPKPPKMEVDEQNPSFIFTGTANISKQGVPINIVYGETMIGSNVISASVDTLQVTNG
tara:strand:- start:6534 stop:7097 length:564 start_codon:yes stop_codon:yes gene_type:complete